MTTELNERCGPIPPETAVAYHVMENIAKDIQYERVYGIINTLGPVQQTKALMLSGDAIEDTSQLTIELGCKGPD